MNHSAAFWKHVAEVLPDYRESRKWLRGEGQMFINAVRILKKTDDNTDKK